MTYKEIIEKIKPELAKIRESLEKDLSQLHTGRPSAALIEEIKVECFGQTFLLKQLAAIGPSGPRDLTVQPWDKSYLEPIAKALSSCGKGITGVVDREAVRVSFPPLSEEYRKELLRAISEKKEKARQTIRHKRDGAWREIQEKERAGELRKDDKYRGKDSLQEIIDEYNDKIEDIAGKRQKELAS